MAKKTAEKKPVTKKPRRRLKRTARRSLAAVLMITAVVVAAIPVPENVAAPEETVSSMTRAVVDKHDMSDFSYDDKVAEAADVTPTQSINLSKYKGEKLEDLVKLVASGDIHTSYALSELDGGNLILSWQFMYYNEKNPSSTLDSGVICKYNNSFPEKEVKLRMQPIEEYYTVPSSLYTHYYDGSMTTAEAGKMDNDPTAPLTLSYAVYKGNEEADNAIKNFCAEYCADDQNYKNALAEFEEYEKRLADYNNAEDKTGLTKPETPTGKYTVTPIDVVTGENRLTYFCQHNKKIKTFGEGDWKLHGVVDGTLEGSGGTIYLVCVPDNVNPANIDPDYSKDNRGYLVSKSSSRVMCAIGDQAFQNVQNVIKMDIPSQIGYIGNDAFANATLLESITIGNTKHIGNRAFKGCSKLAKVEIVDGTETIGKECFRGTDIGEIKLPLTVTKIGAGAFAYCRKLTSVDLNNISENNNCEIGAYAFYDARELTSIAMQNAGIQSIGDGAFAVEAGSQPLEVKLPSLMKNLSDSADGKARNSIGNYLFANRSSLKSVVFPQDYGTSNDKNAKLPKEMLHGCVDLEYVEFPCSDPLNVPQACGFVSFAPGKNEDGDLTYNGLFQDIINPDFYVRGPYINTRNEDAYPRTSTWDSVTMVSNTVPYVYVRDGVEYYEVSDGKYLLCIEKTSPTSKEGVLRSCSFKPNLPDSQKKNVALEIPAVVGGIKVTGIGEKCFSDSELNENVVSLRISDDSITSIANGVFKGGGGTNNKDWQKLETAYIGNSVTSIGDSAFEGCVKLVDVTFGSPGTEHSGFHLGKDAFKTGGDRLTFHGDIASDYEPFIWAMDPNNIIDKDKKDSDGNPISEGIRVCYKSMSPYFITVMYNPITDMVTMLDYPKVDQVKTILSDLHGGGDYNRYRENVLYDFYRASDYNDNRRDFAIAWNAAVTKEAQDAVYASENYGPWVNPEYAAGGWKNDVPSTGSGDNTGGDENAGGGGASAGIMDWLFEPLTVYAADESPENPDDPDAYYAHEGNAYDVLLSKDERGKYRPETPEETYLLAAVENIVVPEGVQSIDVYGFVKDLDEHGKEYKSTDPNNAKTNSGNVSRYFTGSGRNNKWNTDTEKMYTINSVFTSADGESSTVKSVAGLFSGYYKEPGEGDPRGNDTITTVIMNSVKYLPNYAFDNCEKLQTVILGPDCADIGVAPFRGCKALGHVSNNDYYETDNGIIYSKGENGTYVIEECFASRGDPNIVGQAAVSISNDPKLTSVSKIKPGAFEDCDVISRIDFSANNTVGLTKIPENCFKDCNALSDITLPSSVNDIEKGAFAGLSNFTGLLTIYGKEVKISGQAFNKDPDKKTNTKVKCYPDSAVARYVDEYGTDYMLELADKPLDNVWEVTYVGPDYKILEDLVDDEGKKISNPQFVENGLRPIVPQEPDFDADGFTFVKWVGLNGTEEGARIFEDTVFFAQYYSNNGMVGGRYVVNYLENVKGTTFATEYVSPGGTAPELRPPTIEGYEFDHWNGEFENIQGNTNIVAIYVPAGGSNISGGTTNTSGTATNTSGAATNTSGSTTSNKSTSSSTSSSSSSTSTTSTTSADSRAVSMHRVTVVGGSGSGTYATGATVVISANEPAAGMKFTGWTTESSGVTLNQMTASSTMFVMPENDVLVVANFEGGTAAVPVGAPAVVPTSNNNDNQTQDNGNTRVDITKPGISNKDLATANVNGSSDNFIIKISETDEATRAVSAALTNKYGTLDNILYYAMDITLWDATGSYQLTGDQLNGISVDITIPIPDSLVAYGGNNKAGAVVNGDQLESLNENFTTINGVPCIRFRATHFSPYTIYVDTGNLVEGMLDTTPKTGDPIHPKWFLSLGLACLSIILFMKKDRRAAVKA